MSQIVTLITATEDLDVEREFRHYKYAVPEMEPKRLSNGKWLHAYRVTKYNDQSPVGDPDVENDTFNNEIYG